MKQQGFTLIELLVTLSIIALVMTVGSASYSSLIESTRSHRDSSVLYMLLQSTRQLAVDHTSTAVLCPSIDQVICINDWSKPLMMFIDLNKNKKRDNEETLRGRFQGVSNPDISIKYPKTQIRFNHQGMANYYNGTLAYCFNEYVSGIIISRLGRIRFAQDLDGDHIPDVNSNTPVSCS